MPFTKFDDSLSGGEMETPYHTIIIEADESSAIEIFIATLGTDPQMASCECCGSDFDIQEYPSLEQATHFDLKYYPGTLSEFLADPHVLLISA